MLSHGTKRFQSPGYQLRIKIPGHCLSLNLRVREPYASGFTLSGKRILVLVPSDIAPIDDDVNVLGESSLKSPIELG